MVDIVVSVAAKVAEYLVAPVISQCSYVIFSNSHVRQLNSELKKLNLARQTVQDSVDQAGNNMKGIQARVEEWMTEAETIGNKADNVLKNDGRAQKTCFYGWLPNPKVRYRLGKEMSKTVKDIKALIERGQFERVDGENPPPGRVGGAPSVNSLTGDGGDTLTHSRSSIFQGIMKALDDEKHKVIGVYGPGGVGKTTLLEEVRTKLGKEGSPFHMIVKATVSQTPDLTKIQYDIAYALGLNSLKDQPSGEGRKDLLFKRLQKDPNEKVLIILDDLWDKLDLKAVGIPTGEESRGCKLLLSSRFEDVLKHKMLADQTFLLEGLSNDEAFKLFEKTVGDKLKDKELKQIAPKVVAKLAGLPLLITSVASTLKYSDVAEWEKASRKIDESNIETIVKLSYDHLKNEDAKSLFLLCGLIGGTIQVETLFVLGMGLGLFEVSNKTIKDSRDDLNTALHRLRSICLLQYGGNNKKNVTIHDLYSQVVVSTPFEGQHSLMMNSNYGSWLEEKLEKCWAICLADVGRDRLAELMACRFPNLKILMLSQLENWRWMPKHQQDLRDCSGLLDFTYMKELRVLCLRSMHIATLPYSIEILKKLRSLYLDHCKVEDVAILGKLKALQILSFAKSAIYRLPKEIRELTNLRSLNLSNCQKLKIIEFGVLKSLTKLEELHMKKSFDQWMGKDEMPSEFCKVALAELKSLRKIASLEISIPNPTILLEDADLPFENLIRFWINIGNAGGRDFEGLRTMKLKLEGNDDILSKEWVQKILHKTQYLHLNGLREFKENAHELCVRGFQQLKHLDIRNSPSVKYIATSSNGAFPILESLFLENLINLEKICHGHIAGECLSKLKAVTVKDCKQLKYLWCLPQIPKVGRLEEIEIRECDSMRAIFTIDARKDMVLVDDRVEFPHVRRLDLVGLPDLTGFCIEAERTLKGAPVQAVIVDEERGDEGTELVTTASELQDTNSNFFFDRKVSLPNLEELRLVSVKSFKRIWHDELSRSSFCKLATITLKSCSNLLHIFPVTIIEGLHNLKSVEVENCVSFKSLFDCGSLDSNMEQTRVLLPKLVSIDVKSCPSLQSLFNCGSLHSNAEHKIVLLPKLEEVSVSGAGKLTHVVMSNSQTILGFPSLESVSVEDCSDLRYLFPNHMTTTLVKLGTLKITKCTQMKEVITEKEVGRSGAEVMSFPCLSELTLEELDNLISFSSGCCSYDFASLEYLSIVGCRNFGAFIKSPTSVKRQLGETVEENEELPQPLFNEMATFPKIRRLKIKGVPCEELWNDQILTDSFCKLKSLKLKDCDNLLHIASSHMWKRLHHCLENLKVTKCHLIEIIFKGDVMDTGSGKLRRLNLSHLDNLTHIWQCNGLSIGVEIKSINVVHCQNMKAVIVDEGGRDGGTNDIIEFPLLQQLCINDCAMKKFFSCPHGKKESVIIASNSQDACSDSFFDQKVSFPDIREIEIEGAQCKELWNNQIPNDSFGKLESLKLNRCDNLQHIVPSHMWKRLHHSLKEVQVTSCHSTEIIFEGDGMDTAIGKLKTLVLSHLNNLRHIWQYNGLLIGGEIEYIDVEHCRNMEIVIVDEGGRDGGIDDIIEFPLLWRLCINDCPMKKFFSCPHGKKESVIITSNSQDDACADSFFNRKVSFPNIRELEIEGAQCKELWNNQIPSDSFCKLESLKLNRCDNLQRIAPSHMWKRLQCCLENLEVISCRSIEIIYESDGMDTEGGKLTTLVLRDLENLGHIWQCDDLPNVPFPNLRDVEVVRCSHLEMLFPTFTAKFLGQIEELMVESCEDMKQIAGHEKPEEVVGTTITFSKLIVLRLFELPKFRSFLPEGYSRKFPCSEDFPSLRDVSIVSCGVEPVQVLGDWERHRQELQESRELRRFLRRYARRLR